MGISFSIRKRFLITNKEVTLKAIIFILLSFVTVNLVAQNNSLKIGWVDSQIILQQYPPAIKAQSDLDALTQKWSKKIDSMTKELQQAYQTAQKQLANMTPDKQKEVQQNLVMKEQQIQDFRQKKFAQPNGEFFAKQTELMQPIKDKIMKAIDVVRKKEGMNYIFDKAGGVVVLYADPEFDLTNAVLDKLKRGK